MREDPTIIRRVALRHLAASLQGEIAEVYADVALDSTDLQASIEALQERRQFWRSDRWVSLREWHRLMAMAAPYGFNQFDADKVARWLDQYEQVGGFLLQPAREMGVCVYLQGDPDALEDVYQSAVRQGGRVSEAGFQPDGTLRLWWE